MGTQERYRTVLMFGAPGVGKGTQGGILGMVPGFFHMSTGDMFRSLDRRSELGKIFESYSNRGELVPDEVTVRLWQDFMEKNFEHRTPRPSLLLLDGIPRNRCQAKLLDEYLDVQLILHLVSSDLDEMVRRLRKRALQQGRSDDADEHVIRHRLEVYERETAPVLKHYPSRVVCQVDALDTPLGVLRQIVDCLLPVADASESIERVGAAPAARARR